MHQLSPDEMEVLMAFIARCSGAAAKKHFMSINDQEAELVRRITAPLICTVAECEEKVDEEVAAAEDEEQTDP